MLMTAHTQGESLGEGRREMEAKRRQGTDCRKTFAETPDKGILPKCTKECFISTTRTQPNWKEQI